MRARPASNSNPLPTAKLMRKLFLGAFQVMTVALRARSRPAAETYCDVAEGREENVR